MRGIRFYEELKNKNRKGEKSRGTVVAVLYDNWQYANADNGPIYDAIVSLCDRPNSAVCGSGVSQAYLTEDCKRISEKRAREIHPNLFAYLDNEEVERAKDILWSLDRRKRAGETITLAYIGPDTEVLTTYTPIPHGTKLEFLGHITASISARVRLPNGEIIALPLRHLGEANKASKHSYKDYKCARCGHIVKQKTSHYGSTYSMGRFNTCPNCPPWAKYPEFGGSTVWECMETPDLTLADHAELWHKEQVNINANGTILDWLRAQTETLIPGFLDWLIKKGVILSTLDVTSKTGTEWSTLYQQYFDEEPHNTKAWQEMYERWIGHAFGPEK